MLGLLKTILQRVQNAEEFAVYFGHKASKIVDLSEAYIIGVQHLLPTTVDLCEALTDPAIQMRADHIYLLGKHYSLDRKAASTLTGKNFHLQTISHEISQTPFEEAFLKDLENLHTTIEAVINGAKKTGSDDKSTLLILDDGGRCIQYMATHPEILSKVHIVAIEQTTAGARIAEAFEKEGNLPFTVILLARSLLKRGLEAPMIGRCIAEKFIASLKEKDITNGLRCGIVGMGVIGLYVVKFLQIFANEKHFNLDINWFEQDEHAKELLGIADFPGRPHETLEGLVQHSDYIFDCTGKNIIEEGFKKTTSKNMDEYLKALFDHFQQGSQKKHLINCSSEDSPFGCIKDYLINNGHLNKGRRNQLKKISFQNIEIWNGGFPFNLKKLKEPHKFDPDPPSDFQLTRGLILGALLQAYQELKAEKREKKQPGRLVSLNRQLERFIGLEWYKDKHKHEEKITCCRNIWDQLFNGAPQDDVSENLFSLIFQVNAKEVSQLKLDMEQQFQTPTSSVVSTAHSSSHAQILTRLPNDGSVPRPSSSSSTTPSDEEGRQDQSSSRHDDEFSLPSHVPSTSSTARMLQELVADHDSQPPHAVPVEPPNYSVPSRTQGNLSSSVTITGCQAPNVINATVVNNVAIGPNTYSQEEHQGKKVLRPY
jgi:hypothetical protein